MQKVCAALLAFFALTTPAWAQDAEIVLRPAGEWTLHQEAEVCRASRDFTANGQTTSLHIRSYGPQGAYELRADGPGLLKDDRRAVLIDAAFDGTNELREMVAIASPASGVPMLTFQANGNRFNKLFLRGQWEGTNRFSIPIGFDDSDLVIEAANMARHRFTGGDWAQTRIMLDGCDAQLQARWGYDRQVQSTLSRMPRLLNGQNVAYWIIYPPNLLLNRVSTIVQFRVKVQANGAAADCVIQTANWDAKATRQTCATLIKNAKFEPALDAAGQPVDALYRGSYMMVMFD